MRIISNIPRWYKGIKDTSSTFQPQIRWGTDRKTVLLPLFWASYSCIMYSRSLLAIISGPNVFSLETCCFFFFAFSPKSYRSSVLSLSLSLLRVIFHLIANKSHNKGRLLPLSCLQSRVNLRAITAKIMRFLVFLYYFYVNLP